MDKIKKIITLLLLPLLLTGCWDKIEIEDRAFISAVGLDIYKGDEIASDNKPSERELFVNTYVFPNLNSIGKNASGPKSFILSSVGESSFETSRQLSTRSDKKMFFKHMKTVIIGEELAKNSDYLKEQLDALERHTQIGRKLNLMIAQGTAKEIINTEVELGGDIGTYLSELVSKTPDTARYNMLTFGALLESLHTSGNALIPRVVPKGDTVKVAGSGVIKDFKLIGWLGELENRDVMFVKDEFTSDVITVRVKDIPIPYLITYSSTSKEVKVEDEKIKFIISIEMEGDILQYKLGEESDVLEEKFFNSVENSVKQQLEREISSTINKIQKEFKVDILGVGDYLSKRKPKLWKNFKDNWEEIFPTVEMIVKVDPKVRRVGLTR